MKRTIIIFAIITISISAAATAMAQNKGRKAVRQSVHVDGLSGNDSIAVASRRPSNVADGTSNTIMGAARKNSITLARTRTESVIGVRGGSLADGRYTRRANGVTFEGNDEPLWVRGQRNSSGLGNATLDNQAARSSQLVQGNQIGTDIRPRRTGLSGDFNGDGQVDGADYLMRSSSPRTSAAARRRSGITGGDFNTDGPTTVSRSSLNNAGRPQSLSAGTYGRGNRR